jgi:hypothetical protein
MADPSGRPRGDAVHYPDVAAAGDLRAALQGAFDAAGQPLCALHVPAPGWLRVAAEVRVDDRMLGPETREAFQVYNELAGRVAVGGLFHSTC